MPSWSACSKRQMLAFLKSKQSDCLFKTNAVGSAKAVQKAHHKSLPGLGFSPDQQCRFLYGHENRYSMPSRLDICTRLYIQCASYAYYCILVVPVVRPKTFFTAVPVHWMRVTSSTVVNYGALSVVGVCQLEICWRMGPDVAAMDIIRDQPQP